MDSKISPITLALLALLAYRTYQGKGRLGDILGGGQTAPAGGRPDTRTPAPQGGGGLGDILGSIFGGGAGPGGGGRPVPPGGQGGGLGDILGSILGGGAGGGRNMSPGNPGAQSGGLGGLLGGLLAGGAAGGLLSGGLDGLLKQFQQNGQGDTADSWIGRGQNRAISPQELEEAVGKDTLQQLSEQSGRPYMDVLSELSESLPGAVDQLTPDGRVPTHEEADRWV